MNTIAPGKEAFVGACPTRHHVPVHISPAGWQSLHQHQPFAQESLLCPPQDRYDFPSQNLQIDVPLCVNGVLIPYLLSSIGRVCVPIPIEDCENFDPSSPPTVPKLARELNEYDATHPASDDEPKLQGSSTLTYSLLCPWRPKKKSLERTYQHCVF